MAEEQAIVYAPQWNNMTVDNNYLREFWSTNVAYDPFPSTDETEQRPLKEFLIKFLVLNGQRPLNLNFNTFCSSTGLDYKNAKYVAYPTPEVVKKELGKIAINPSYLDKTLVLKNSFPVASRILFTFVIQVNIGEIIYSDLITKLLNKSRLKYVSYPRFISCALQVLLGYEYTQDVKFGSLPGILSNSNFTKDPSKFPNIELTAHMIDVNNQKDSVSLPPLFAKKKKGKSQTMTPILPKSQGLEAFGAPFKKIKYPKPKKIPNETKGTSKSQPLLEGTTTDPKDSWGNDQPADKGLPSTASNEGTAKTSSRPEGTLGDKDSGGNKPPADMEPIHPTVVDPSGTSAKYQVDQTQSTRLRYQSLTKNEAQESEDAILGAGDEMDEDSQTAALQHQFSPPHTLKHQTLTPLAYALKQEEELAAWVKSSTNMAWNLGFRLSGLERAQNHIQSSMSSLKEDTLSIKSMMTEMYQVFKGGGGNETNTATKDPPFHTEGETDAIKQEKSEEPKHSTDANIEFIGKGIATEEQVEDQRKLVKASSIVRPDPDALVLVPYTINGKLFNLTIEQIQANLDKEEQIKKIEEVARLLVKNKPEVIKVVQEEAKKLGIHPKEAITGKAGKKFKKAQDAEHEVLKKNMLRRNFNVHNPFAFGEFGISELDELMEIIPKKKNTVVKDLMNSLSRRYERIKKIPKELGIPSALPAPILEQASSKSSRM
ncbi:hypothetical protein Tco_0768779 [Tanacetum coccineum]